MAHAMLDDLRSECLASLWHIDDQERELSDLVVRLLTDPSVNPFQGMISLLSICPWSFVGQVVCISKRSRIWL